MTSGQRTTNVWVLGCAVAALFFAGYATRLVATDVVVCHEELKEIPEPGDWRAWNRAPDFGVCEVNGERGPCVLHGLQCALENSELRGPDMSQQWSFARSVLSTGGDLSEPVRSLPSPIRRLVRRYVASVRRRRDFCRRLSTTQGARASCLSSLG